MTREEAIQSLKQLRTFHNGNYAEAVDMATEALSCSEIPNRWIPVSERSPEESDFYRVTLNDGSLSLRWYNTYADLWEEINGTCPVAW